MVYVKDIKLGQTIKEELPNGRCKFYTKKRACDALNSDGSAAGWPQSDPRIVIEVRTVFRDGSVKLVNYWGNE